MVRFRSLVGGSLLGLAALAAPAVMLGVTGCMNSAPAPTASLYDRLGGDAAISAVVDDFVNTAAADPAVNFTRAGVAGAPKWDPTPENVAILKKHLTEFIEVAAGGPQKYEGRPNKEVHAGMKITEAEFGAIAKDLSNSLDKFKVPQKEHDELMAAVAGTHDDIVQP